MVILSVLVLSFAIMLWPTSSTRSRLVALADERPPELRWARRWPGSAVLVALAGIVGALLVGVGGGIAAVALTWTLRRHLCERRAERDRLAAASGLSEALELLVGELKSGAHPASAAENVAADADSSTAKALRAIASTARLGGDIRTALHRHAEADPLRGPVLTQLGDVWSTAENHGVPLAELLGALQRDLSQRVRFAHQVDSRMAGPRATASVLAVLPVIGLLLGEAMGAAPVVVLVRTGFGQVLLVLGVALMCAGLAWSARLTSRAAVA